MFGLVAGIAVIAALDRAGLPVMNRVFLPRAAESGCRVLRVVDGDTLTLACPGIGIARSRLVGVDAPEIFSPRCARELRLGLTAKLRVQARLWTARDLAIVRQGRDRYDRVLTTVFVDGESLSRWLVDEGLGRPYDGGARAGWCS
ncbi:thermonuclease family protein [Maritimibacter sp. DP1N21-5]|uniref:thermonuclease family protein n=1 Tax=Maritimibacter sp. DP1N21-5 TaxID=2836867 RepID=UPI001C465C5E|nr:thermonuclease family protein [Maritimibacter sp. DP1N21-5]MBV7409437.1 thermonuclease family protein [Maritimibacter sp. DP1N21-5]